MSVNVDMSVKFAGLTLKNPIVAASGTFGFGREYEDYFDVSRLGAICVKGLTLAPRQGNPPPRIAETPMGMLNSVGLQNPGVEAFLAEDLPWLRRKDVVVIANICGDTAQDYGRMAELLGDTVDMLEVNISCPNVKEGGIAFGAKPGGAAKVTEAVKRYAKVPVCVKLSPNTADITAIAKACANAGADALSAINTLVGMRIDTESRKPVLHNITGGLSGPAVLPVALRCVWQVSRGVSLPVLGMGGISRGRDAAEMMMAGAAAVAIGTATIHDPYAPMKILAELTEWCAARGIDRVGSLTGSVQT